MFLSYENEKLYTCLKLCLNFYLQLHTDYRQPDKKCHLTFIQKDVLDIKAKVGTKAFSSRGFEDKSQLYNMNIHHSPNWK